MKDIGGDAVIDLRPGKQTAKIQIEKKGKIITEHPLNDFDTVEKITSSVRLFQLLKEKLSEETKKILGSYGIIFPEIHNKVIPELLDFEERLLNCREILLLLIGIDPDLDEKISQRLRQE